MVPNSAFFFTLRIDVGSPTLNGPLLYQLPDGGLLFYQSQGLAQELHFNFLLDNFFFNGKENDRGMFETGDINREGYLPGLSVKVCQGDCSIEIL